MEMSHPTIQSIKKQFFTYRNGILADMLKNYGDPHEMIFGLDVPQIALISKSLKPDSELAETLWSDREVRESRLLAPYLFPIETVDITKAMKLASDVRSREEADMLSFRLLKHLPDSTEILSKLKEESDQDTDFAQSYQMVYTSLLPHFH